MGAPHRRPPRVLVFGTARSGTTWVASILGALPGTRLLVEPDTPGPGPYAIKALGGRGPTLVLGADDRAPRAYRRLWTAILGAGPPRRLRGRNLVAHRLVRQVPSGEQWAAWGTAGAPRSWRLRAATALSQPPRVAPGDAVVAKTVTGVFALDWLLDTYRPSAIWVRRHPLDAVAGRRVMAMPSHAVAAYAALAGAGRLPVWCPPPPDDGTLGAQAWYVGLQMSWCREVAARRSGVREVAHEDLCRDPVAGFEALARDAGLAWHPDAVAALHLHDRAGEGYTTDRVTAEQPGKWRTRLDAAEQREAIGWLRRFPIAAEYAELA